MPQDFLDAFRHVVETLMIIISPVIPASVAVLIAYINRGIDKVNAPEGGESGKEGAKRITNVATSGGGVSDSFQAGLIHHIALQERRIAELEAQLANEKFEKQKIIQENRELRENLASQEERISKLETAFKEKIGGTDASS